MTPEQLKQNLTAEQWETYEETQRLMPAPELDDGRGIYYNDVRSILEALAERNALLRKYEWRAYGYIGGEQGIGFCHECGQYETDNHRDDCKWKAALAGLGE